MPDQIEFLMMHDSDPFNRWQAAQTYAVKLLTAAARRRLEHEPGAGKRGHAARPRPQRHGQ